MEIEKDIGGGNAWGSRTKDLRQAICRCMPTTVLIQNNYWRGMDQEPGSIDAMDDGWIRKKEQAYSF